MPDSRYLFAAVAISAAITWGLRAAPFAALSALRASKTVEYLRIRMPTGVMVILLVYCLRAVPPNHPVRALAPLAALGVTVGVHLWRRNALLSILLGTLTSVILASALHE